MTHPTPVPKRRAQRLLVSEALLGVLVLSASLLPSAAAEAGLRRRSDFPNDAFYVRSYLGKCLTYGVGAFQFGGPPTPQASSTGVYVSNCAGIRFPLVIATVLQRIDVKEIADGTHNVRLHAGSKVIGVAGGEFFPGAAIELQDEDDSSAGQIFALDGDSIILAADRSLVLEVMNGRGANGTPLILGQRDLADSEFWDFQAINGADVDPTSGFVRINQIGSPQDPDTAPRDGLLYYLHPYGHPVFSPATPGTVLKIGAGAAIDLTGYNALQVPAGVTIRGDRRGTLFGPELSSSDTPNGFMLEIHGDDVRIAGLRLRGPSRSTDSDTPGASGIAAHAQDNFSPPNEPVYYRGIVDHNDLSDWPTAAIAVVAGDESTECRPDIDPRSRPISVRILRNFIHDNRKQEIGYGVSLGRGGFALIEGNTFSKNRHSIAADGLSKTGYRAWDNLVLSEGLLQHDLFYVQDFDMHGTESSLFHDSLGGTGGEWVEILRNTFLGTNRPNFNLRGLPCVQEQFVDNVSLESRFDAVRCQYCEVFFPNQPAVPPLLIFVDSQFESDNPTDRLGVGDFDGDGKDDLFLATGQAFYYAPNGKTAWRFLSAQTDTIDALRFGDFDGDGRTDVFAQHGSDWVVSWGGISPFEKINESNARITDFAIGDFDGNHRADVFYADGAHWWVSYGGVGPFVAYADSSYRVSDLRFGDFDGDGRTDVFGVVNDSWTVVYGGTNSWAVPPLRPALTQTVDDLFVADFDGDGRSDIGTWSFQSGGLFGTDTWILSVSKSGRTSWKTRVQWASSGATAPAAAGRFDAFRGADALLWSDRTLFISSGGRDAPTQYSTQDMR